MSRKSVTVKAAWITAIVTGAFLLVAALIGIVPAFLRPSANNSAITAGDQHDGSIMFVGGSSEITIYNNVPPTETKEAIAAIERRLEDTSAEIRLNREELRLLARALSDLDQRTSDIEKLPDGRTRFGTIVAGSPTIVVGEHNAAVKFFKESDFVDAFDHSELAIKAYESSKQNASLQTNRLKPSAIATVYYVGAMSAHRLKRHEKAYEWAEKANTLASNADRSGLLAATLFNIGRRDEAMQMADRALKDDPNNPRLRALRAGMTGGSNRQKTSQPDP